ncbi:MAG: hypothetical protein VKI82_16300 [Leptolyngbya sp.]|nr:hypothetical protein [Leptolyngbya sp.]
MAHYRTLRRRQPTAAIPWRRRLMPLALAMTLALGLVGVPLAVAPPAAEAYTSRLNLFLVRDTDESFETFLRRSEIIARAGVQRSFDSDVLMTDVVVTIIGESQGLSMPVLAVAVSRSDWQRQPDVLAWVQYYPAARALLP